MGRSEWGKTGNGGERAGRIASWMPVAPPEFLELSGDAVAVVKAVRL
jgi:hypothetical protein